MANRRGPILVVAVRHRPFEIAVLLAVLLSTAINLFVTPTRTLQAINTLLPGYSWVWSVGIIIGSIITLSACFMTIPNTLLVERIGLYLLGMLFSGYSIVAILVLGIIGFSGAFFLLTFALACIFRIRQLNSDIRQLKTLGGDG